MQKMEGPGGQGTRAFYRKNSNADDDEFDINDRDVGFSASPISFGNGILVNSAQRQLQTQKKQSVKWQEAQNGQDYGSQYFSDSKMFQSGGQKGMQRPAYHDNADSNENNSMLLKSTRNYFNTNR